MAITMAHAWQMAQAHEPHADWPTRTACKSKPQLSGYSCSASDADP
jgi:hypothetical protein